MKRISIYIAMVGFVFTTGANVKTFAKSLNLAAEATGEILTAYGFSAYEFLNFVKKDYQGGRWRSEEELIQSALRSCQTLYRECEDFRSEGQGRVTYWARQPKTKKAVVLNAVSSAALNCHWSDEEIRYESHRSHQANGHYRSNSSRDCSATENGDEYCDTASGTDFSYSERSRESTKPVVIRLSHEKICSKVIACETWVKEEWDRIFDEEEAFHSLNILVNQKSKQASLNKIDSKMIQIVQGKNHYCH